MANFAKRLKKLEARFTDVTGLVPQSEPWFDYWYTKLGELGTGQDPDLTGITLDVIDSIMERARQEDERDRSAAAEA